MKEYLAKWYMKCITFLLSFLLLQPLLSQSAPVGLIENKGQISDQYGRPNQHVQMLYNDGGFHVQLNDKGFSYEVFEKIKFNESHVSEFKIRRVDIEFEGANRIVWRKEKPFSERYNFYNRVHVENVQAFHMATAIDVWPGVSIQFKVDSSNAIKYEIIAENTDVLSAVRLRVRGADQIDVKSKQISFSLGEHLITDDFPRTFLDCDQSKDVKLKIIALSHDVIGFETTKKSKCKLIIDPIPNLKWATYYGAGGSEHGYGVAADNVGDPFFCGSTTSSSNIATSGLGVYQVNYSGSDDAYLVKFLKDVDPTSQKSVRKWCTYFGDQGTDIAYNVAIDSQNNIYMVGESYYQSSSSILYRNKLQTAHGGKMDGFVAKFDKDGKLKWSNFFGGSEDEVATSVFVGNKDTTIAIVGQMASTVTHAKSGGYKVAQSSSGGGTDAFLLVLDSAGNRKFSTYYGGSGTDIINDVSISRDSIFVVGQSNSTNFSRSSGSFSGNTDGFLSVFARDGSHLSHLYLGGSSDEAANAIECLADGGIYVAGTTNSSSWSLLKGHQSNLNNSSSSSSQTDAFLLKLDAKFKNYWGTYYGGDLNELGNGITTDRYKNVYLAGSTESSKHISTTDTYQDTIKGGWDAYLIKFYPTGTRHWGTYFGGGSNDYGQNVTTGEAGDVFLVGRTSSTSNLIYRAYQASNNGSVDAYFADFNYCDKFLAIKKDTSCGQGNFNISLTLDSSKFVKNYKGKLNWNYKFPSTYVIKWTGPNSFTSNSQNISRAYTGNTGTYTVVVVNDQGCSDTAKIDILYSHPKPYFNITKIDTLLCFGDCNAKITAGMRGGTSGKTWPKFKLSTSSTYTTSGVFSNLCSGTYTLNLVDSFGCKADTTITIKQPAKLIVSVDSLFHVDCNGNSTGLFSVKASGGVVPYQYSFQGGVYGNSKSFRNLKAGSYIIGVKDKNGCLATVTVVVNEPTALSLTTTGITNVLCKGASTGVISVVGSGGVTPYSYNINGSSYASSGTFNNLKAGTYSVAVKDANGCIYSVSITVTEPSTAISISSITITNVDCNGASTGNLSIAGTGGVSPYTYNINSGTYGSSANFGSLKSGSYTLCIKDDNGCTACSTVTVTQPLAIGSAITQVNVSCNGYSDGSVNLTPSGGVGPYTYYWTGPGTFTRTTQNLSSLSAGTYNFQITDANGCIKSGSVTVLEPTVLSVSVTTNTPVDCKGNSTGRITVSGSGGVTPYTYNISGGTYGSSSTFSNLSAGSYTIGIQDKNGCASSVSVTVTEPTILDLATTNIVNVGCKGASTGEISVSASGGTTAYQYNISGGAYTSSNVFKTLSAGTYTVGVKDKNGCTKSISVVISEPANALVVSVNSKVDVDCKGNSTGSITVGGSGGTPSYSFNINGGTYGSSSTFSGLVAGSYTMGIKDANGCTSSTVVSISEPTASLNGSTTQVNVSCNGLSDGSIALTPSGGTTTYKYYWTGPGTFTSTSQSPSSLLAGTYNYEITDANGCKKTGSVTIVEPTVLSISVSSATNVLCKGNSSGSVTVAASGGNGSYSYNIGGGTYGSSSIFSGLAAGTYTIGVKDKNGCVASISQTITEPSFALSLTSVSTDVDCNGNSTGKFVITGSGGTLNYTYSLNGGTYGSSNTFSGLSAGNYSITIKDGNGCTKTILDTIYQPAALSVSATSTTNVDCKGNSTGSITVSGSGGTGPYTYKRGTGSYSSSNTFSGLAAGTYTIDVKDANGCLSSVNVTITEPANSLSGTTTQTNVTCNGLGDGSITLTPSGGTSSYSYSWSGPGTYTSSSQSPSGLAAGTYTYKITDSKGCTSSSSATISEPSILKLVLDDQKNVDCNGNSTGSVKLSATGGSPSYTYSLNSGTFGTATAFSSLSAGSYQFNVKDKNGCVDKFTIQITEPGALIVTATVTDVSCDGGNDGVIKGAATGGTASYQYKLGSAGVWQNSVTFNKLSKGTYTLYVRDTNLCVASSSVSVSESVVMSAQLDVNSAVNLCEGSTHYFSSSRSTITSGSYSVDWDFGDAATASGNSVSHKYSKPGTYTVTMTMVGSTGCKKIKTEIVKVYPMPTVLFCPIDVKGNCESSQCLRGNDFNFSSTSYIASGSIVNYEWDFRDGTTKSGSSFSKINHTYKNVGQYNVTLTLKSDNGCVNVGNYKVDVKAHPVSALAFNNADSCFNSNYFDFTSNGTKSVVGSSISNYSWNFGNSANPSVSSVAMPQNIIYNSVGQKLITLIVTDLNTCTDTSTMRGEVYPSPEVKFVLNASTPNKTQCFKGNSFKFENKTTIKTGTVKYKWDFGDGSSSTSFNPPNKTYSKDGKYTVTLTATSDINCSETVSFEVIVLPSPKADFSTNAICSTSYSIVFKDASVLTNGKINSHIWDFGDGNGSKTNNPTHTYSYSGSYLVSLIVESDQGCKDTVKKSISAYDKILAKFDVNRNTCGVSSKIKFTNQSLAPLSSAFSWNFGDSTQSSQTSPEHQYNRADTFLVTLSVTSPDGCVSKAKESIQVYSNPEASFDINSLICDNSASANFTNKSSINPKDTIYYQWQFGDGNTSVVKNPSYTYGSYGSFKVNLKATSSKGCVDSMVKTISVRPMPKVDFEISDFDHCLNSNFVFVKDQTTLNSGTYKYNWSMGDQTTISNKSTVKHTYKTDTTFEIKLKVVSDFGCSDSLTKSIEIYANPVAKISIDSPGQCLIGNDFQLVDSSVVNSSGFIAKQYWDFGDGTNDSTSGSKIYKTYGSYGSFNVTLRVVSQRGCSDIVKKPISVYDMPNADFTVNSFKQCLSENEFRFNNQSTITAGNGALNYEWDLGNGQISTNISPTEVYTNHGTYNVTLLVSSVYGCTNSIIKPIEVYQNPDKPNIAVDRIIPCYGMLGSLRATVTGGVTPYLYSWNYGNATLNNGIDSLPAGVYRLDITDGNGCKSYDTFNLTQPDILEAKVVKLNDALCYGFANAKAKLDSIRGGVAPYYTEWYLGNKLVKVGELLSGVKSDYYKVLMRDFNGCGFLDSIYLSQPNKLEGQISILSPIKCYDSLGSVGITVKGGIKNPNRYLGYDFYWNGSRSPGTNQLLGVQAGLQKVMVYDSNGCALALSIELKEPSKLIGTLDSIIDVRCFGESNGRLHASAKGGLLNYSYLWTDTFNNFIAEGQKLDGLKAGYYKLVVKDRNGCVDSVKQIYEVLQPDPITVDLLERMNITCFNGSNGKMRVGAKGGNGGYEYEWMTVPISTKDSFIENLSSGRYVLKVNDSRGCALETIFALANPLRNPVLIQNDSVEVCKNDTLYLRANMNQSIAYQWIFNGQNMKYSQDSFLLIPNVQNGSAGIYTVIGTDQLGCQDTAKLEVFMNELPTVNLKLNPVIACLGSDCEMEATGANKYTWYKERYTPVYGRDTLLGNGSIYKFTGVKQTDVGKYFVMGESIQGCKNEDFVYLKVGLDSIVVPNDTQVCAGSTFALRAKGGVSYDWVAPNGKSVNSPSYIVSPVSRSDSGIYTLNVVDRWNCSGKYKVNVMVNPRPKISVFDALLGDHCEGTDVELIANTDAAKMSWMGPDFTQMNTTKNVQSIKNVSIKDQGYYKVVAYSVFGCMDSATTFVKVNPIPLADFAYTHNCPPNPLANEAVNFFTTSLKASKYEFYIDNVLVSKDQGFTHKFTVPGSYVVKMKAMNEYLCFKEITQSIVVEEPVKLNVPNAFTPNNDRLNSEFKPVNVNVPNYKMLIYDRWGSKMYEEMNGAWDGTCLGKPVPIGVYVVIVEYSTICSDDKLILDKRSVSDVTLMR